MCPPIRPAISLPPGGPHGVGAHAQSHAELEHPGKRARRGHADHERLQDADARLDLHHAHEPQQELDRHRTVGIEHDRKLVPAAPALAEIPDVSCFVSDIAGASTILHMDAAMPGSRQGCKARLLRHGDIGRAGIAKDVHTKMLGARDSREPLEHRLDEARDAFGRLVADAQKDGGGSGDGLIAPHAGSNRQRCCDRVARKAHDQKPDRRIPEADREPGHSHCKEQDENKIERAKAVG